MIRLLSTDLLPFLVAFAVTAALGPVFIPWLHKLKFGQEIRDEGPKWHQKKSGTPTMGGIMFILGIGAGVLAVFIITLIKAHTANTDTAAGVVTELIGPKTGNKLIIMYLIALGFGAIGFIDDFIKVVKKRNLGLTSLQKLLLQIAMTVIYVVVTYFIEGELNTRIWIPFTSFSVNLPIWSYIPFIMFVMVGVVNAVNLTDGLDGLAASVTLVEALYFTVTGIVFFSSVIMSFTYNAGYVHTLSAALAGGMVGFLVYNHYPAKVFMGDTGSLFLGGIIALIAIDTHMELLLIISGFVYFMETLSVIIQTSYFKYTRKKCGEGRRVFKMTPIHHHFEMSGWNEKKIVAVFSLITLALCIVAFFGNSILWTALSFR